MASNPNSPDEIPHILVLGTGGTIAGLASHPEALADYRSGEVGIQTLLDRVKEGIPPSVKLKAQQIANIDSSDMSEELLTQIGNAVKESLVNPLVKGVVITHGTDTIEETGLFLSSVCGKLAQNLGKRVVLTGAMLPANAPMPDGPQNLLDAIRWSSTALENCPGGVFAVFAGKVCLARDLAKRHTTALNAPLMDSQTSPIGLINPSWLSGVKATQAALGEDLPIPQGTWPWVEIATSHAGCNKQAIEVLIKSGLHGLVLAGTGFGGVHQSWVRPLQEAQKAGIALVRASRAGAGAVSDVKDGLICELAGSLTAPKARIALQLALNAANEGSDKSKSLTWQDFFARIAVLPEYR